MIYFIPTNSIASSRLRPSSRITSPAHPQLVCDRFCRPFFLMSSPSAAVRQATSAGTDRQAGWIGKIERQDALTLRFRTSISWLTSCPFQRDLGSEGSAVQLGPARPCGAPTLTKCPARNSSELGQGLGAVRQAASLDGEVPFRGVLNLLLAAVRSARQRAASSALISTRLPMRIVVGPKPNACSLK